MNWIYLSFSVLIIALAITLSGTAFVSPLLAITSRRQFDDWKPLLNAFREAKSTNSTDLRASALKYSWCDVPLPYKAVRAPYCGCVERAYDKFANQSDSSLAQAKDDAIMSLVGCLANRPVWRVSNIWGMHLTTPAIYLLFVVASFLWLASGAWPKYVMVPITLSALILSILIMIQDYIHNIFWLFMFLVILLLIELVLKPGFDPEEQANQKLDLVSSSFWWCEYFICPVFALYVPIMHCGRDIYFISVFTMIGTAVGGLGLRSFWCTRMYASQTQEPKSQFMDVMQYIVWLGILASCVTLSFLTAIYYNPNVPYVMGPGSVALLAMTFVISLLQWPGYQKYDLIPIVQQSISIIRIVIFFALILTDLFR
jgi:hypothetical protein